MRTRKLLAGNVPRQSPATFVYDDILSEIFIRVPAKSLIRLKCVCKQWLKLISSPSFGHDHACRISYPISGFYFYTLPWCNLYPVSLQNHQSLPTLSFLYGAFSKTWRFDVLDSCNGLMLCKHGDNLLYTVSNPATQKYNTIPPPPLAKVVNNMTCLDFDPTRSPHYKVVINMTCLDFDPKRSPHYKVVIIRRDHTGYYEIDIYLSKDKHWRRVYAQNDFGEILDLKAFWDGAVHWLTKEGNHLRFDVDTEKLVKTRSPDKASSDFDFHYLRECGGDLLLVEHGEDYARGYRIHVMRMGTRCWRLKHFVLIRPLEPLPLQNPKLVVLSVLKRSQVRDMELVLADSRGVYSYDIELNTLKVLYDFPLSKPELRDYPFSFALYFIESLSPV